MEEQTRLSCGLSAKPRPRRRRQGSIRMSSPIQESENNIFPPHSVKDYKNAVVNCSPGSVHGMKVFLSEFFMFKIYVYIY